MGITRIDDLPERSVQRSLLDARQAQRELKGSDQFVSGANLAYRTSVTASQFDWVGQLDGSSGSPGYGQARLLITLTAKNAKVPLVDLEVLVYFSTDGVNYNEYSYRQGIVDTYANTNPQIWRTLSVLPGVENGPGESRWQLQLFGQLNARVAVKLQAVGTDDVTFAVARVA